MQLNYASKYKSFRLPDQASVIGSCASHRLVTAKEDRPRPATTHLATPRNTGWLGRVARTTYTVCDGERPRCVAETRQRQAR